MAEKSEICKFYDGQNVLITGGTGFMGKILIEKLLRSTDVATIFVLIRTKKGMNAHMRLDEIFDSVIFERLKKERPKFKHRVVPIAGDCSIVGLGLTITDRQKLIQETNVVFHVAATVRFDENLKLSYAINVNGTADVIELCKHMKHLKSVVHVSTAYSNCHLDTVDEKFYDYPVDYDSIGTLLEKLSRSEADKLTPRIIGKWPNTYTFTKALAESLIRQTGSGLPVGIFRPAIVISTYKEPIESWIDNLYGPTGACAGAASGLLRVLYCDKDVTADVVPVDTCVAGIIASAWDISRRNPERTASNIPIYNYVSSVENPLNWQEYNTLNVIHGVNYPLSKCIWAICFTTVKNPTTYLFLKILLHFFPALIMDTCGLICGQRPRLFATYRKIHRFSDVISFFCTRDWTFKNNNTVELWEKMTPTDQKLFPFSIKTVPWILYFRGYMKGIRVHLMRDPLDNLESARVRKRRLDVAHNILTLFLYFIVISMFWYVIRNMPFFLSYNVTTTHISSLNTTCDFLT